MTEHASDSQEAACFSEPSPPASESGTGSFDVCFRWRPNSSAFEIKYADFLKITWVSEPASVVDTR